MKPAAPVPMHSGFLPRAGGVIEGLVDMRFGSQIAASGSRRTPPQGSIHPDHTACRRTTLRGGMIGEGADPVLWHKSAQRLAQLSRILPAVAEYVDLLVAQDGA